MMPVKGVGIAAASILAACAWLAPLVASAEETAPQNAEPAAAEPAPAEPTPPAPDAPDEAASPAPAPDEPASPAAGSTPSEAASPPATPPPSEVSVQPAPAAPPEARHGIGVRLGARATTVREDLLVPLTFSGGGPDLGASYRGLVGPGLLDARMEIAAALVGNRFNHLGLTTHHELAAAYRLPLPGAGAWRFALGGVVGESSDSLALESWDDAHGYWVGLTFLGPSASVQRVISPRWQLHGTAELALVGTVGRPSRFRDNKQDPNARVSYYLTHPFADSGFFAPWNVQLVRFDVAVRRTGSLDRIGRGWSFGCQGRFTRASEPLPVLVFETVLYAAWTWGL